MASVSVFFPPTEGGTVSESRSSRMCPSDVLKPSSLILFVSVFVQTGQTRWSREASITLLSPHAAHCDSIAWVPLLSRESWSSLRAGETLEGGSRKEKVTDSI